MSKELLHFIEQIGREKGLGREVVIVALEEALSSAIKKRLGTNLEMHTNIDRVSGNFQIWAEKRAVEKVENRIEEVTLAEARDIDPNAAAGDIVRVPQDMNYLGRIAAQIAKQVIIQKVREAERDMIHTGYKDREGELITGRVLRRDRGDIVVDLGKVEAILPKSQQISHESFRMGDHVRGYIHEVQKASRGPQIILSRIAPQFLARLFELEVPEISEGIVEIKGVVREPGERAKVAVRSNQRDVDPVGACVGVKGSRVQAIVRELRGEKIDVIEWAEDIAAYVKNALSPASIEEIRINKATRHILVIVPDDELSQAIGKKGQNVRLASRLVEWEIDIKSRAKLLEESRQDEEGSKLESLATALGVPIAVAASLVGGGYPTIESLAKVTLKALGEIETIDKDLARQIKARAKEAAAAPAEGGE
jgi:N utilization substance protein A